MAVVPPLVLGLVIDICSHCGALGHTKEWSRLPGSGIDAVRGAGTGTRYAIPSGTWYDLDRLLRIAVAERNTFDRNE